MCQQEKKKLLFKAQDWWEPQKDFITDFIQLQTMFYHGNKTVNQIP